MKRSLNTAKFKKGFNTVSEMGRGMYRAMCSEAADTLTEMVALNFELPGDPADRLELLPGGSRVTGRDGRYWINDQPQAVVDYLAARKTDLVLDYNHATELKAPKGEDAPAAGWLSDVRVEPNGAITAAVEWTPRGREAVLNREYRYLSPVILHDKELRIRGLSSVALTNKPNLLTPALNQERKDISMKNLLKALGLPETATEQEALNAMGKLQGDLQAAINAATTPSLDKFVPRADYDAALNRASNAEQKLAETQKAEFTKAVNAEVDAAVSAGKITPATADFYKATCADQTGLDRFREFVKAAPEIGGKSGLEGKTPEGMGKALNAEEQAVCKNLGISPEEYSKANPA